MPQNCCKWDRIQKNFLMTMVLWLLKYYNEFYDQRLIYPLSMVYVTNMAPFMPFRVILVIEWQHNTWTNMIVWCRRESKPSQPIGTGWTDGSKRGHRCIGRPMFQRRCQEPRRRFFSTGWTGEASVHTIGVMTSAPRRRSLSTGWTGDASVQSIGSTGDHCVSCQEFNGYFGLWVTGRTDATHARGIGSSGDTQFFS